MANSDRTAEIDSTNVELAEYGIHTKTSLAESIRKTRYKWAMDDFTKYSNNNLITSLIINIGVESATHIEKSLTICRCQVDKLDCSDIGNIDHINKNVISSWKEIIWRGGQLIEVDTDIVMDYDYHKSNFSDYPDSSMGILEPIIGKIEMSEKYLTEIESSCLGNNLQAIILYDII